MLQRQHWTESVKKEVWEKAEIVKGHNPDVYRKDLAGAWIKWSEFGNCKRELGFGWVVDHINPVDNDGSCHIRNLQPMQWRNNEAKSNNYPLFKTVISSLIDKNIRLEREWRSGHLR